MKLNSVNVQNSKFRLGFDGGGTNTRAVVVNAELQVLGRGESGASNPYAVGMDAALANIEAAAEIALRAANLTRDQIGGWGLGLGGVCSPHESAAVEAALRARVGAGPQIVAVEDVVATWQGAFGTSNENGPRAICIAGTGVGCWGKNGRGEVVQADGAGPLLGDRGSGYWIGERALRHAARVCDGVAQRDDLAAAVLAYFGADDLKALIRIVYAPTFERSRVAELVPIVLRHANQESARAILQGAGRELAATSLAVLKRLSEGEIGGEVALIGGVLAHAAPVKAAFVEMLRDCAPGVRLVAARFEPALGAALLV